MPKVTIVFGEDAAHRYSCGDRQRPALEELGAVIDYQFKTQAELNAFVTGVDEAIGWQAYEVWEDD